MTECINKCTHKEYDREKKNMTLKQIALELLKKYEDEALDVINE